MEQLLSPSIQLYSYKANPPSRRSSGDPTPSRSPRASSLPVIDRPANLSRPTGDRSHGGWTRVGRPIHPPRSFFFPKSQHVLSSRPLWLPSFGQPMHPHLAVLHRHNHRCKPAGARLLASTHEGFCLPIGKGPSEPTSDIALLLNRSSGRSQVFK